jgi:NAD-dependent dihydropyrimidine dehydrogenase PreA subunit
MHHEINKALYDAFSLEEKGDALGGYLYLKYTDLFMSTIVRMVGIPVKEPDYPVDKGIAQMMELVSQQVIDAGATRETSIYHGKVVKLLDAIKLVTQRENLHLMPSERVVPFKLVRDIILESPDSIAAGSCPCRAVSENPCLPPSEQVCLFVGEPNASFLIHQNPSFRKVSQKEAVRILEDCHKHGFVHCAYFEKLASNRFNAICNCCSCCCMGIKMWHHFGFTNDNTYLDPSGYIAEISDGCSGCAECIEYCHFHAISMDESGQQAVVDLEKCMGCGVCEDKCPVEAISLCLEPSRFDPLDIEAMKSQL